MTARREVSVERAGVEVPSGTRRLPGTLAIPESTRGVVVFAHGSGSGRLSPRNQQVAARLNQARLGTLLLDLLDEEEAQDRRKVFDIELLADRLLDAAAFVRSEPAWGGLPLGLFGASTGAAAALVAAAQQPDLVGAVVSRGGRPDLAGNAIMAVTAPTLLIVGGADEPVLEWNRRSLRLLGGPARLFVVPGATHLFAEPGALEQVAGLACDWFLRYLKRPRPAGREDGPQAPRPFPLLFRDRVDAGRRLGEQLRGRDLTDPLVLGIPRGGVVVAAALAAESGAEMDVVLSRKMRVPGYPECALAAISEDGEVHYLEDLPFSLEGMEDYLAAERAEQLGEICRRRALFRAVRPRAELAGRSVILTDDGVATGATMIAALHWARTQKPRELIVAVPVASPDSLADVSRYCDETVCLAAPQGFRAVGEHYSDFTQVEDEEVLSMLREARPPDGEPARVASSPPRSPSQ